MDKNAQKVKKLELEVRKQGEESHINKGTKKHKSHSFIFPKKFQHFELLYEL